jgi:glycolate oxidase subunit GlcD
VSATSIARELVRVLGDEGCVESGPGLSRFLTDATELRGLRGSADAAALPRDADEVAAVAGWCHDHNVAMIPRGAGTGYAGGAVPDGGVVISLERLRTLSAPDPGLWRLHTQAGVTTAEVQRIARENGLYYPPDPGAAESSQIGGNIATNAGGPHAFRHGVTGHWVTGLEAVLATGERIEVGGPIRKDVAGYDLKSLLIGSEGTLAIVTGAWLRLIPAPAAELPVIAWYADPITGAGAIEMAMSCEHQPAALEFLDREAMAIGASSFPAEAPRPEGFAVIAEAQGSSVEAAEAGRDELLEALSESALGVHAPSTRAEVEGLWRWRDGIGLTIGAVLGGKASDDIVVPIERLAEAVEETLAIASRHGLRGCSWGHAGDGNLHSTFLVSKTDAEGLRRAAEASDELMRMATSLGGSISGEHGVGLVKNGHLADQWPAPAIELHEGIKRLFDPKNLLNPGKKLARTPSGAVPTDHGGERGR